MSRNVFLAQLVPISGKLIQFSWKHHNEVNNCIELSEIDCLQKFEEDTPLNEHFAAYLLLKLSMYVTINIK